LFADKGTFRSTPVRGVIVGFYHKSAHRLAKKAVRFCFIKVAAKEGEVRITAEIIKNGRMFIASKDQRAYSLGFISGYLLCQYNHADGIGERTYLNLLKMIERGARTQEMVEYLERTLKDHA
jgi:hypothetical protein